MIAGFEVWNASVNVVALGLTIHPVSIRSLPSTNQLQAPEYQKFFDEWKDRPDFKPYIDRELKSQGKK